MSGVPILVEGTSLRVLIVGGGAVAARRATTFGNAGATVRVVARAAGEAIRALAAGGHVTLAERPYDASDIGDAMLVVAATDDRATNAAVAADAHAAHRLANVVDAPGEGSFSAMATHRTGGLVIAVGAGVPAAAARVRDAVAARFDERFARAVDELAALRERLLATGQGDRWRTISVAVIDADFCDAVDTGRLDARMMPWR